MSQIVPVESALAHLEASIADLRLSDEERRELVSLLRAGATPEEGLRRVRNRAFELVRERLVNAAADTGALALLKWLDGVARALDAARGPAGMVRSEAFFSPGEACLRVIVQQLRAARKTVDICVFTLSDDRISAEVLATHRRGVALRLITDNDKEFDSGSDIGMLRNAGVPVAVDRTEAHMHHKFAVIDGEWLLNGSYNWTRGACQYNEENLIRTSEPALVSAFSGMFAQLWAKLNKDA